MTRTTNKKLTVTALLLFLILQNIFSQNNLRFLSSNGAPFKVIYHEKVYNVAPQAEVLMEHLTEDTVILKFEFENKQQLGASIYLLNKGLKDNDKEHYYIISQKEGELKLDFKSISEIMEIRQPIVPKKPSLDSNALLKSMLLGHFCEIKNDRIIFYNNIPSRGACLKAMPDDYLTYLDELMKKNRSSIQKNQLGEEVCKNNCLNVKQLKNILNHVENEFDKLVLIKLAFFNLVDTTNKNELKSSFRYDASLKELNYFFNHSKELKAVFGHYCNTVSGEAEVNEFIQKEGELSNDSYRLDFLKKRYYYYCFSITHVSKILEFYLHDREKLEAAKLLYFKCADKTQYQSLYSTFSFQITVKELEDFLNKQKQ